MDYREPMENELGIPIEPIPTMRAVFEWTEAVTAVDPAADRLFQWFGNFIDLILEPESAESAIANLDELYQRRLTRNPVHAKRWLIAQVGWIALGRAMELLSKFSAARAGK
jgi:hypothetical protein